MAISRNKIDLLQKGLVIPAHPLALTAERELDEKRQRRLTKYYLKAGVGGLAVGVHTTQFAIRDPAHNFLEKVFALTAEEVNRARMDKAIIKVAGISGTTGQAILEAQLAYKWGYDLVLLSSNGLGDWTEDALLDRAREIAQVMPLFGFYLQPAVGGRILSFDFWKDFAEIPEVQAIKIAPFNRYQTLDVVRAVVHSSRNRDIALYTGNDDNIVGDLLTTYNFETPTGKVSKEIVGGLLGHWAFWTRRAVELLEQIHQIKKSGKGIPPAILSLGQQITDANAAVFDATNQFAGCIPGIHAILHRQGLLNGIWCLDAGECLSAGQQNEIDRIYSEYPELN
ncbi:MAG: dihydrodipicolinate synthase family protein, partial [Saprospiraceae bacterium]|nr:dihydrodipicolinate synthase family protein [Saprospiraceae bacterium]